jgi:hypothetical protein
LRGKAVLSQTQELLDILRDVLLTVRLDNPERFRQMVLEEKAEHESGLASAGHMVVNSRLRASFNEADWAAEQMGGVSYLFFLRELAQAVEQNWPSVLEKLQGIRAVLLNRGKMICNVTLDQDNWLQIQPRLADFIAALPSAPARLAEWHPTPSAPFEGLTIPAQVNYVGKGADLYPMGYKPNGSISVINNYLRTTWLWERVRVQGGAYGGFCTFDHRSGAFTFLSYRDPNLLATLDNYDQTGQFLRQLDRSRLSQDELVKSIIGAIGDMDAYQLPDAKGYTSMLRYLAGDSDESRQVWRDQILGASIDDFRSFGEILERMRDQSRVVVLGSPEAIQSANASRPGWLEVRKVL